jgi:hypothetical protein
MREACFWICITLALLAFWASAHAGVIHDASLEYSLFTHDPVLLELPNNIGKDAIALNMNLALLGPLYWDNQVHMINAYPGPSPKWVGWLFETGLRFQVLDVFYRHHSQHAMDGVGPLGRFPVQDALGVRVKIYP